MMLEGVAVGAICGFALDSSLAVLAVLVVPPFTAGLYRGVRGVISALCSEFLATVAVTAAAWHGLSADESYHALSWAFSGLGLGLIGAFLHGMLGRPGDPLAAYYYAQSLLRRLISVSEGLATDLDPVSLGSGILTSVNDELPTAALALYVPRGDGLTPLVTRSFGASDVTVCEAVVSECYALDLPLVSDGCFAFPLRTDTALVGAVVGTLSRHVDLARVDLSARSRKLAERLRPSAVHLDTALLFAAFRDSATAEERRRLAREMHDGVAQDIASLGYLVDALAAGATDDHQQARIQLLRDRVTGIVAEVRRSLVALRTSAAGSESLGAAIAAVARNLSEVSGVPIHVTVDEHTDRLRPEVEGELFRIAQEAMNNAVKHAEASAIRIHCQVRAPAARITVSDDGRGFQGARRGSYGLSIMRERARLVGAGLEVGDRPDGGFIVTVSIPREALSGCSVDTALAEVTA